MYNQSNRVIVVLFALICLAEIPAAASVSGWHQFQKDSLHVGTTSDAAPGSDPVLLWSMQTGAINVPPLVAGDLVYVYDANGTIWAFDRRCGSMVWRNETSPWFIQSSTPAYGDDMIFAAERDGDLHAFDAATGECLWKAHATDHALACPVTYRDHRIYIGESYCKAPARYFCYDENGTLVWSSFTEAAGAFEWCGACVVDQYLIYPTSSGNLVSLFRENGTIRDIINLADDQNISFTRSDVGRIRASVSHHRGYLYVASEYSQERGYIWKIGLDCGRFIDSGWSTEIGFSTSTPVVHGGRVYVGVGEHGCSGNLVCLNDSTGDLLWSYPVPAGVKSSPVLSISDSDSDCGDNSGNSSGDSSGNGGDDSGDSSSGDGGDVHIYFTTATANGSLYCLRDCGASAELAWTYNPPDSGYILQGAAISDGRIYFGTDGGYVYCIGRRGDLNYDGEISAADALIALRMAAGSESSTPGADMDGDCRVTSVDALIMMQHATTFMKNGEVK